MATFYNVCENELSVESCRKCSVKGSKIPVHVHLKAYIYIYIHVLVPSVHHNTEEYTGLMYYRALKP